MGGPATTSTISFRSPPDEAPLNQKPPRQINRQYVARVCLVLAPAHLRQGQPRMVRTPRGGGMTGRTRRRIRVLGEELRKCGKSARTEELTWNLSLQPRLHPQGRSRPQVRPEHLPSVLP